MADLLFIRAAAYVEEVGRHSACVFDDVHGRHGQARAVHHAADVAVELDVVQVVLGGLNFERVLFGDVAQFLEFRVAEHGVIVDRYLRIERNQATVFRRDQGIDFEHGTVALGKRPVQALHELDGGADLRPFQPQGKCQLARLIRSHSGGFDVFPQNRVGILFRHLLDFHTARSGHHDHGLAFGAVHQNRKIQFAVDGQGLFNEQPPHYAAFGSGLVRDQRHAENLPGQLAGFLGGLGNLDAAALAAASGVNLRFDDRATGTARQQLLGNRLRLFRRRSHFSLRHGDAILPQNRLALILVNFHGTSARSILMR